ncbi:MAG: dolichol kinase [Thermoplasmata archaeon]|nr:MAG: dolichol kinase [Thermoplasmata archaeon]RLF52712.1 MAG: dolichol kinase [Thermoplasmata archaeon]
MGEFIHWYRRLAHVSGSAIISYYMLPDEGWIGLTKKLVVIFSVLLIIAVDVRRIRRRDIKISCLRDYEERRVGGYVYFGMGSAILLLFFPQQISIPCIVSTSLADPLAGEMRKLGLIPASVSSMLLSFFIFFSTWLSSPIALQIAVLGALSTTASEFVKSRYIDDDLLMQIVPAILMYIVYFYLGKEILPDRIIYPMVGA